MIQKHVFSFRNALAGLRWIYRSERNFKVHILLSCLAILAGLFFRVSRIEFLVILILIGMGLAIETVNTAIEEAIDAIHKDWSEEIKVAKDVSAAAMLIFALTALVIACVIFIPRILNLFS